VLGITTGAGGVADETGLELSEVSGRGKTVCDGRDCTGDDVELPVVIDGKVLNELGIFGPGSEDTTVDELLDVLGFGNVAIVGMVNVVVTAMLEKLEDSVVVTGEERLIAELLMLVGFNETLGPGKVLKVERVSERVFEETPLDAGDPTLVGILAVADLGGDRVTDVLSSPGNAQALELEELEEACGSGRVTTIGSVVAEVELRDEIAVGDGVGDGFSSPGTAQLLDLVGLEESCGSGSVTMVGRAAVGLKLADGLTAVGGIADALSRPGNAQLLLADEVVAVPIVKPADVERLLTGMAEVVGASAEAVDDVGKGTPQTPGSQLGHGGEVRAGEVTAVGNAVVRVFDTVGKMPDTEGLPSGAAEIVGA